jgi:hypothetical protein
MPSLQAIAAAKDVLGLHLDPDVDPDGTLEYVAGIIDRAFATPNAALPPLDTTTPRRKMVITIEVAEDFEKRFDNQWMVEREIAADRWSWEWAP